MITTTVEMNTPSLEEIKDAWNVTRKTVVTGEMGWKILQRCPSFKFKGSNVGYTDKLNVIYSPLCKDNEVLVVNDAKFGDEIFQAVWDKTFN